MPIKGPEGERGFGTWMNDLGHTYMGDNPTNKELEEQERLAEERGITVEELRKRFKETGEIDKPISIWWKKAKKGLRKYINKENYKFLLCLILMIGAQVFLFTGHVFCFMLLFIGSIFCFASINVEWDW